jgi:hypothetical protein
MKLTPKFSPERLRATRNGSWQDDQISVLCLYNLPLPTDSPLPCVGFRVYTGAR